MISAIPEQYTYDTHKSYSTHLSNVCLSAGSCDLIMNWQRPGERSAGEIWPKIHRIRIQHLIWKQTKIKPLWDS